MHAFLNSTSGGYTVYYYQPSIFVFNGNYTDFTYTGNPIPWRYYAVYPTHYGDIPPVMYSMTTN